MIVHILADPPTREQGYALVALALTGPPSFAWFLVQSVKRWF